MVSEKDLLALAYDGVQYRKGNLAQVELEIVQKYNKIIEDEQKPKEDSKSAKSEK